MQADSTIVVAAVDDHPLVLRGLGAFLAGADHAIRLAAVAPTVAELLDCWQPDIAVVLLDISLGDGTTAWENVAGLRARGAQVILFTSDHRPAVVGRALRAGAVGLVLKEDPEDSLIEAIRQAAAGQFCVSGRMAHQVVADPRGSVVLSKQEEGVLRLLARGLPWSHVARRLAMSPETARTYCYRAMEKYARSGTDVTNGPREMAFRAIADGHVQLADSR